MSTDYFAVATGIVRQHEAERRDTAARLGPAHRGETCRCGLYPFPHRPGSCDRKRQDLSRITDDATQAEHDQLESYFMDRDSAAAINSERGF